MKNNQFINDIKQINRDANNQKKYSIRVFGCQMNEHDAEKLSGMLNEMGYVEAKDEKDKNVDIIIFITCCVRENAEEKVFGHLGALKALKEQNPDMIIAVCGCMMQQEHVVDKIKKSYRQVDIVFGTHNLHEFPKLLYRSLRDNVNKTLVDVWNINGEVIEGVPVERNSTVKAYVNIAYGCNNFCSYCIVPYVRGRERSREIKDILEEVKSLSIKGYKEITLLGQNVNSYGNDLRQKDAFSELLRRINDIEGIERIRFMTSHPKDLSDELIYAICDCDKVCEHLHLPYQSGSSRILRIMNRNYTKEHYLALVDKIKQQVPNIAITTDIIVGFPGETEEDFQDTLDVFERVRFDFAYMFLYSKRTGTKAAEMDNQVDDDTKKERFERLMAVEQRINEEKSELYLNKEVEVLVEGLSKNSNDMYTGRTRTNKLVNFKSSSDVTGQLVNVKIVRIGSFWLEGES